MRVIFTKIRFKKMTVVVGTSKARYSGLRFGMETTILATE